MNSERPQFNNFDENTLGNYLQSKYASQFLTSGETEEESPRWTQPNPMKLSNNNTDKSLSMHLTSKSYLGTSSDKEGQSIIQSAAQETFAAELDSLYQQRFHFQQQIEPQTTERTDFSRPTIKTVKAQVESHIRFPSEKVQRIQDAMTATKIIQVDQNLANFVERLHIRQHLYDVNENLTQIESILLTLVAQESPGQLYNQILQKHTVLGLDHQTFGGQRTHVQALKSVELLAAQLKDSFRAFVQNKDGKNGRNSPPDHFNDNSNKHMLLLSDVEANSFEQSQEIENVIDSFGIQPRRVFTFPTSAQPNSACSAKQSIDKEKKSANTDDSNTSTVIREHIKQANALQSVLNLEEIKLCNEFIENLKLENAKLEMTVNNQRSQIRALTEQVNEWTLGAQSKLTSLDKKEIESLVRRLREDLDNTKKDRKEKDFQIAESNQVIAKLQGQILELKQKLVTKDDVFRGEHSLLIAQKVKEVEEIKRENHHIAKRYQEMVDMMKQKEIEMMEVEDKSKRMLNAAQKDAEDCISYFKGLAYNKIQEGEVPIQTRKGSRSREREANVSNVTFNPQATPKNFPKSLAPVTSAKQLTQQTTPTSHTPKQCQVKRAQQEAINKGRQQSAERVASARAKRATSFSPQSSPKKLGQTAPLRRPIEDKSEELMLNSIAFSSQVKLETAMHSLSRAFNEIAETKAGVFNLVSSYQQCYCEQMQKFQVLAYDYIERISNLAQREAEFEDKIQESQEQVDRLKFVTYGQAEHIKMQSVLIQKMKESIRDRHDNYLRICNQKDQERDKVVKVCADEFPNMRRILEHSTQSLAGVFDNKIQNSQELNEIRSAHGMLKSKVKILEEELDKALIKIKAQEEVQTSERAKSAKLADLIKDIWMAEVQKTFLPQNAGQFTTMASYRAGMVSGRDAKTNKIASTLTPGKLGQIEQTQAYSQTINQVQSTNQPFLFVPEVPMPISWLSDIAEHIKQLKEMNDFQRDEVYQLLQILSKNQGLAQSNPSVSAVSSKPGSTFSAKERVNPLEESSTDGCGISENEIESTQNNNSSQVQEDELSERISERNFKIMQQHEVNSSFAVVEKRYLDKKEVSFSHRLSDDQTSTNSDQKISQKRRSTSHRPVNSANTQKKRAFQVDPRLNNCERSLPPAKSRNSSGHTLIHKRPQLIGKVRVEHTNTQHKLYFAPEYSPRPLISKQSRSPGFTRATSPGHSTPYIDTTKRNELYSMLHDEVFSLIKEVKVGKETVYQMKQVIKKREQTIKKYSSDFSLLLEKKQAVEQSLQVCDRDLKQQERQNEELQMVVEDKEDAIENLKMQIEEFERELVGLQEQMTHVVKLNSEISQASEHWEKSYHDQIAANTENLTTQEADFKVLQKQMQDKLHQFKRKLAQKDLSVKDAHRQLDEADSFIQQINTIKMTAMSVATNTGPEFELLEKQNQALKEQLTQVKEDIAAVLDQYESEQVNNQSLNEQLHSERNTKEELIYGLNQSRDDNKKLTQFIKQLQNEVQHLANDLEQDQNFYKEQMNHAQAINEELQQQVEAVTQLTEELQEQIASTSRSNNELAHRSEQEMNQRRMMEQKLASYAKQVFQSNDLIQQLQAKIDRIKSSKRESRSFSISRIQSIRNCQNSALVKEIEITGVSQMNDAERSRMIPTSIQSSCSKLSKSAYKKKQTQDFVHDYAPEIRNKSNQRNASKDSNQQRIVFARQVEATLQTNSSIFDEEAEAEAAIALGEQVNMFNQKKGSSGNCTTLSGTVTSNQMKKHDLREQREQYKRQKQIPSRRKRADRSVSPITQNTQQHSTHTGTTGITGHVSVLNVHHKSASSGCCCNSSMCRNKQLPSIIEPSQESSKMFTEESTFREQLKSKNEVTQYAKKKVRKLTKMLEELVRHYCTLAKDKNDLRMLAQGRSINQEPNSSISSTIEETNELHRQLKMWVSESAEHVSATEKKNRRHLAFKEAKMYFDKHSPTLVACLNTLAENYNPAPAPMEAPVKQVKRKTKTEPSRVVTGIKKGEVDLSKTQSYIETETEISDNLGTKSHRLLENTDKLTKIMHSRGTSAGRNSSDFNQYKNKHSRGNSSIINEEQTSIISIDKITSPTSSTKQATGTFRNSSTENSRLIFAKLIQIGRSLAGICYGGCIFMGQSASDRQRQQVDFALQYLSKDSNEVEIQIKKNLEEATGVIESLLSIVSAFLSSSCQSLKQNEGKSQAFESLQKSEFSVEVDHSCFSRDQPGKSHNRHEASNNPANSSQAQASMYTSSQIKEKLLDVEQKIKSKFTHISQLEGSLDSLLKPNTKGNDLKAIQILCQDPCNLQKVLQNIKRAVSKLKIELHSDYLVLGQINIQCQSTRDQQLEQVSTLAKKENFGTVQSFAPSLTGIANGQSIHRDQDYQHILRNEKLSYINSSMSASQTSTHKYGKYSGASLPLLQSVGLQRQVSQSSVSTQPKNHAIDRIVEELKGLTFEH